jgi:dTDP-glucose pyrophosphorylase
VIARAVVLARGLGTRMRQADVTLDAVQAEAADRGVKAMMPIGVGGRPFLDFILSALADAGCRDICLVVGPDHQQMREHYRAARRVRIAFAVQAEPRGTADALLAAETFAAGDDVLVLNGDNYYPIDAVQALRELDSAGTVLFDADALIRASNIPADRLRAFAIGVVDADDVLIDLIEKPDDATWAALAAAGTSPLISMNCWRLPPAIFDFCRSVPPSARGELELPHAIRQAITVGGVRLRVVRSKEGVLDLSRRGDVATVAERLRGVRVEL